MIARRFVFLGIALAVTAPAHAGLSLDEAEAAAQAAWTAYAGSFVEETDDELAGEAIEAGGHTLRFKTVQFADGEGTPCTAPCEAADERAQPLFISLHGGGAGSADVNDEQWENQIGLADSYAPADGIYLAPRAPTDTWDCWHSAAVDPLLERLIRAFIAAGTVDPDRIYLMGYSAGGDGVYALAPRLADRLAAASMMAGHPNGVSMRPLRNLPFSIQVGERDTAYDRASVAAEYGAKLDALQKDDPEGYAHFTEIHAGKEHWMDGEDRIAVPWMEKYTRDITADRVVWRQTGQLRHRFYWLAVPEGEAKMDDEIIATREDQTVTLSGPAGQTVLVRLNDDMVDLDDPVSVVTPDGEILFEGVAERSEDIIARTIDEYGDYRAIYAAEIEVTLP